MPINEGGVKEKKVIWVIVVIDFMIIIIHFSTDFTGCFKKSG